MMKVLRIIAGIAIGLAGVYEGVDIATGGKLGDKLTHMADDPEEEFDLRELDDAIEELDDIFYENIHKKLDTKYEKEEN